MINLPIYRAKKIDSDKYVKGCLVRADDYDADVDEDQVIYFIMEKMENYRTSEIWDFVQNSRIDPATLSIHFPDMLDSQGNKIFASLQEDGKGGDIIETELKRVCTTKYKEYFFYADNKDYHCNCFGFIHSKIIGIQQ